MRAPRRSLLVLLLVLLAVGRSAVRASGPPPPWAYPVNPPGATPAPDDGKPRHVPGSTATFTLTQIRDLFRVPDWHPGDHPPLPPVVARGRKPAVYACGYCHLPNGLGRPENAALAGLTPAYIKQQVADFKSGARRSAEPASLPVNAMVGVAEAATDAEVEEAAAYFGALPAKPWIRVVEADRVPRTKVAGWMLVAASPAATEPIGQRVIELPEDLERTELRDAASGFLAYVPVGSIQKGEALVTSGGAGRTLACGTCHGSALKGAALGPALAGRSPSYLVRQLWDMQHGLRNGPKVGMMKPVVAKLTLEDMVSIAAYVASRTP